MQSIHDGVCSLFQEASGKRFSGRLISRPTGELKL